MNSVKRTISQFWEDHRKGMPVVAAVTWSLLLPLISLALAADPLKVGGLPVNGMSVADIELVEMNPPDMPAALYAGAVAAYATGEPFGAVAEKAGYARPLYLTRDVWPNYICCVLTVREELIKTDRALI